MRPHLQAVEEGDLFPVHGLSCHHAGHEGAEDGRAAEKQVGIRESYSSHAPHPGLEAEQVDQRAGQHVGQSPPDIEAMVRVWGVLGPLEQRSLKLDGDLGDRVGRQLNQHL